MPDVQDCVAVGRTGHGDAVLELGCDLKNSFAALAVLVLERRELVDAYGFKALEQVFVFNDPFGGVMICDDDVRVAFERCFSVLGESYDMGDSRLELLDVVSPRSRKNGQRRKDQHPSFFAFGKSVDDAAGFASTWVRGDQSARVFEEEIGSFSLMIEWFKH